MSRYVESGTLDAGITGKDWTQENQSDVIVVTEMVYSKVSFRPTRWVLAVPHESPIKKIEDLKGKRVATEMVNFTKRYFAERNIPLDVEFSWGATEAKAAEGLVDAIVEVTETGTTIRAHGLRIVAELMESCPQLIANKNAWQDPWKREKLEQIKLLLQGAKILDDAVMHYRHLCRHMRMCIGLDGLAVRGPARVADAGVTEQRIGLEHSFEIAQLAFGATTPESSILHGGDAGGVITAILEALQRVN